MGFIFGISDLIQDLIIQRGSVKAIPAKVVFSLSAAKLTKPR